MKPITAHTEPNDNNNLNNNKQCVCNIGAQHCFVHDRHTRTQEEKIAFRLAWDARVDAQNNTDARQHGLLG